MRLRILACLVLLVSALPASAAPTREDPGAARVRDVLRRAERNPGALAALDTLTHPAAAAWRAFFLHAGYGPGTDDPRGTMRALRAKALAGVPAASRTHFETSWTAEPPPALVSSMRFARDIDADTPGEDALPCWMAERWMDAWLAAYTTRTGAIDSDDLPACTLPQPLARAQAAWDARLRTLYRATYGSEPVCSSHGDVVLHRAALRGVQALHDPEGFRRDTPDLEAYVRRQHDHTLAAIHDLWSPRTLDPAALERMWRAMDPPAAWTRVVTTHYARTPGRSAAEAGRLAATLAAYHKASFLEGAGGCRWVSVPPQRE
jgi:hypothetical protein